MVVIVIFNLVLRTILSDFIERTKKPVAKGSVYSRKKISLRLNTVVLIASMLIFGSFVTLKLCKIIKTIFLFIEVFRMSISSGFRIGYLLESDRVVKYSSTFINTCEKLVAFV